ncbi:hypothetical protein CWE09_00605 [Aliidiomarina minuta]|uniref:UPF0250 protein CWE09_00605 n=1 Tax=Aliidiomarina minuta TaxID=880057 RepID=A0A432W5C5_9GAMM|nr:DUF493 family protein YbeD [Aliidiomarina minuta]RUO25273.1 hypothetical protein CWE09_00605 [Aliidiomarina minuta]
MQTKFDELLDFPCNLNFKIMGVASDNLTDDVLAVIQQHAPGDYKPQQRPSSKGNYVSLSVSVIVTSKEHIELLYREISALEDVRYVL